MSDEWVKAKCIVCGAKFWTDAFSASWVCDNCHEEDFADENEDPKKDNLYE